MKVTKRIVVGSIVAFAISILIIQAIIWESAALQSSSNTKSTSSVSQKITTTPVLLSASLPQIAKVECWDKKSINDFASVTMWEFPGLNWPDVTISPDSSDAPISRRGKVITLVPNCSLVRVSKMEWSEMDKTHYMYVEYKNYKGWMEEKYINSTPHYGQRTPSPTAIVFE